MAPPETAAGSGRPRLSFRENLAHAVRVRSAKTAAMAAVNSLATTAVPLWWQQTAPWYAGRLVERLGLRARVDGAVFSAAPGAHATSTAGLLFLERYETLERHAVARLLPPALPLIDLGASIGVVSCLANRRLIDPARHVAVEANPDLLPVLRHNRDRNACRFEILHAAVAYGSDVVSFGVSAHTVASSLKRDADVASVDVRAVTLGNLIGTAGFQRCALVCDIEGGEEDLVAHDGDALREAVEWVMMEVHPEFIGADGVAHLYDRFQRLGFDRVWMRGDVWVLSRRGTDRPRG